MFYGMAAVLIYMMLIGDFFADIAQSPLFGYADVPRQHLILASLVCVFPLSIPRNVTALRYISFLSTGVIVFLTAVVVAKMPAHVLATPTYAAEPAWQAGGRLQTALLIRMAGFWNECFAYTKKGLTEAPQTTLTSRLFSAHPC